MYIILFLWFLVLNGASSQTFIPSSSWRKPNIITSPSERVDIARAALELAISHLNISDAQFDGRPFGVAGILYAQMAEFDLLTNQTKYQSDLKNYFSMAEKVRPLLLDEFVSILLLNP
ncbi:hypothetical protein VKT23_017240 [Stygiomarasmius scandens]|uniref:Uncharacterized protein n=1 Tax=Marasmiellus scandens TaxID=2682957 RepID=A0ABR1IVF8_9AGAR